MRLKEIYKKYPDSWVLVNVISEDALGEVTEAEVIKVSRTEGEIHEEFSKLPDASHVAIIFTGKVLEKGQSFSLGIIS